MSTKKLQVLNSFITTDTTLKEVGKAADAKAVGDALASIEYTNATEDENGIVVLGKSPQSASGSAGIDDSTISTDSTWSSQKLLESIYPTITDIGDPLAIEPITGSTFGDIWTTVDAPGGKNILSDWQNPDNWEIENYSDHLHSVYRFPISEGVYTLNLTIQDADNSPYFNIWELNTDGSFCEKRCEIYFEGGAGTYTAEVEFSNPAGSGMAAIEFGCPSDKAGYEHFSNLEILQPYSLELFYNGAPTLTISNGTETKTYEYGEDWGYPAEAIAYNWTTGQTLNIDGSIYENVGVPIEIVPLPGINTLQSSIGATKVTYYPNNAIRVIDDSKTSASSTWSSQKISDNMASDLRVRAEVVDIDPAPNTEINEVITWLKYDTVELADTVGWRDMDNWKTINQGEDEYSGSWLQYLVIPTDGGKFNISGMIGSWGADVNYAYISNVNEDGTLGTNTIYSFEYDSGDGSFNVSDLEWFPGYGDAHAIAFVIDSIWPSEFLIEFSCLYNKQQYMYDSSDIWLTVVKDGVKTTYSADTPCIDWCQNMGYNWLTGQGLDEDGNVLEDYFWGNAYPELANIGKATFISNVGTVSVDYMSYPNKTITVLQNEVKELRRQVEKLIDTVAALDSNI